MCNHNDRLFKFPPGYLKQTQYILTCLGIQISGRLICQDNRRFCGKCSRDRHPLLLPAGELTVSLEGEEYLGILSLPTLALELPVGAEWEMDFLRQAPCRYAGTLAGDDIIIAAHNYRRHFAALHTLRPGDAVLFTDAAGQTYRYTVDRVETLPETAVEEMRAGEWDLTLFTCTYDGRARVTVRCIRTEE